jgi:two-component system response regulator CpxR
MYTARVDRSPDQPAVLLVDDDVELCQMMAEFLGHHGFRVSTVHDGRSGLGTALKPGWDLVILDVMLPVLDGFEVLRQMRRRTTVPTIMLTARAEERDRVSGLDEGADDYLVKPFATAELLARIRALLRRTAHTGAIARRHVVESGDLSLDVDAREVRCGDAVIALSESESGILEVLMRARGRTVSRDELAALLYQREATPYERSVDVHVSHLRKKLEPCRHATIRSARGVGYVLPVGR